MKTENLFAFQNLDCYRVARELAQRVHTARIRDRELRDQATRASKSCFLCLCEGLPNKRSCAPTQIFRRSQKQPGGNRRRGRSRRGHRSRCDSSARLEASPNADCALAVGEGRLPRSARFGPQGRDRRRLKPVRINAPQSARQRRRLDEDDGTDDVYAKLILRDLSIHKTVHQRVSNEWSEDL